MSRQSQRQSPADLAIAPSLKLQNDWKCLHLIQHQVDEGCTRTYLEQGEDTNRPGCVTEGAYSIRMRGVDSLELLTRMKKLDNPIFILFSHFIKHEIST